MRIGQKGQVTIPAEIRERFGLLPDTEVDFVPQGDSVKLVKRDSKGRRDRGTKILQRLAGSATVRMTTDEIMALTRKR